MRTVTRKQFDELKKFFNEPIIISQSEVRHKLQEKTASKNDLPFKITDLQGYEFGISKNGGQLYDGEKLIGSMGRLSALILDRDYWGKNLGAAMVAAWAEANTWYIPKGQALRTAHGKQTYIKGWEILEKKLTITPEG